MAIKTRSELELCFKNGTLPTERHFQDLIHSMLNRREDNFFGKWKAGMRYCPGDVVLCKKSFYIAVGEGQDLKCEPVTEATRLDDSQCFCSATPPDQDRVHWSQLELEVSDEDWVVVKGEPGICDDLMYAGVWGRIGMGTPTPKGRVDITVAGKGSFLFDPDGREKVRSAPEFAIRDATCDPDDVEPEVRQSITPEEAYWYINVPGYAFRKVPKPHEAHETDPDCPIHPELLMFVTTDEREMPAVGIGTKTPYAALETFEEAAGRILLRPGGNSNPELVVVNLSNGQENYFKIAVEQNATIFRNPKGKKFLFRQILDDLSPLEEGGQEAPLLAITQREDDEGNLETMVGIGTEDPRAHLEVTDRESGSILLSLSKTNPALAIVNMRPRMSQANYMTLGVNNKRGVFVTDSPNGFEFRQGNPCGGNDNELDIDQHGKILLSIDNDAKIGIGKHPSPLYELDVKGEIKSFGSYLETHRDSMENTERLNGKEMLEKLRKIHPVSFNWKDNAWRGHGSEARQIGIFGHEVADVFEELVKNLDDGNQAVAYQNLVAVLIPAINELSREVKELKEKLERR